MSSKENVQKHNLPDCENQTSAGGEHRCCSLKWMIVINDPGYAERSLKGRSGTLATTACIPGSMGSECINGVENQENEESPINTLLKTRS